MTPHSLWHVYVRDELVIIPRVSLTTAGYFLDTEPVAVSSLRTVDEFARALDAVIAAGNPSVPTPTRDAFPKPVVLDYARVRSWKAFERASVCFSISRVGAEFELFATDRDEDGQWTDSPGEICRIPVSAGSFAIVEPIMLHMSRAHNATS